LPDCSSALKGKGHINRKEFAMKRMQCMVLLAIVVTLGLLAGCSNASTPSTTGPGPAAKDTATQPQVWTCPMHPELREAKAGKCPKCGMDLVQQKDAKK